MKLVYNDLPRPLRERFATASHRDGDPAMLAAVRQSEDAGAYAVTLAIFGIAFLILSAIVLSGGGLMAIAYRFGLFVVGAIAFTIVAVFVSRKRYPLPPYRMGTYVFGPWIVEAKWGELTLESIADVARADTLHKSRNGSHYISTVSLYHANGGLLAVLAFTEQDKAARAVGAIEDLKRRYLAASQARDAATMTAIDPFFGVIGAPPEPAAPGDGPVVVPRPPTLDKAVWGIGAAASFVVTALFGSIGSCVQSRALSSEIDGKVAASKAASHDKYEKGLAMWKNQAASDASTKFMKAAFDKMEDTRNSNLMLRFHWPSAAAQAKVDAELPKGAVPLGGNYEQAIARKKPELVLSLSAAFSKALPYVPYGEPSLLTLSEATTDDVLHDQPRIEVTVELRAARDAYKCAGHPKPYGGVSTRFHVVASVPGSSDKLTADIDVPPPPADHVSKHYEASNDLYIQGSLFNYALDQLQTKLKALFLK